MGNDLVTRYHLPNLSDVVDLIAALVPTIENDYRAHDDDDDDEPTMLLTIGSDGRSTRFGWQTGDNSYTGGAYGSPHWGVASLWRGMDESNMREVADDLCDQLADLLCGSPEFVGICDDCGHGVRCEGVS